MAGLHLAILILNLSSWAKSLNLQPILEWKRLEYETPNPIMTTPFDVAVYYPPNVQSPRIFLTIPRYDTQNPMTLVEVTKENRNGNRIVKPFPDKTWHSNFTNCPKKRLVSVYRTRFDKCGRMWVLDSGFDGTVGLTMCQPQILAFNITTNKLVHYYEIPDSVLEPRSLLLNLVLDVRDNCDDLFIYIGDSQTYSMLIYDAKNQDIWKITDKSMYPNPNYGTISVAGTDFELMDGILGMDIEKTFDKDRKLFYTSLNSGMMNWVYTSALKDKSRFDVSFLSNPNIFHKYRSERPSTSGPFAIDTSGISYFGLSFELSLNCWHTSKPDFGNYIFYIYQNNITMQFISGIKIVFNPNTKEEELWWITTRLQKTFGGEYDPNEVNYRIFEIPVSTIKKHTSCTEVTFEA